MIFRKKYDSNNPGQNQNQLDGIANSSKFKTKAQFTLNINNSTHQVDVAPDTPVLWVLRDHIDLVGTKFGCGIGHAMYSAMTFADSKPDQSNFNKYRLLRHREAPQEIEIFFVQNGIDPTGLGEPSLPPIAAALANAIYAATGKRLRQQPFVDQLG